MTIKIEDNIDDLTAISLVKRVIEQGKISNNSNSYCYLTLFGDICVETRQYRKSPCFRVYKETTLRITYQDGVPIDSTVVWKSK